MSDALVKHAFVSPIPDGTDATKLRPSNWNAALIFSAGNAGEILTRDPGSATGAGWLNPATLLSGLGVVLATRTVNGHPLTADVIVAKADLGLGNVENTALSTWPGSANLVSLGTLPKLDVTGGTLTMVATANVDLMVLYRWDPPTGWEIGAKVTSQGAWYSNAQLVITGTGNVFAHPSPESFMIGVYGDVDGPMIQVRGYGGANSCLFSGLNAGGQYRFSVEDTGALRWGVTTRAAMDTTLYRQGPNVLQTDGALIVGSALNLGIGGGDGLLLQNTTPATAAVTVQVSPRVHLLGTVWNTTASVDSEWFIENRPLSSASPLGVLYFRHRLNAGTVVSPMTLDASGNLAITGASGLTIPNAASIAFGARGYLTGGGADGQFLFRNTAANAGFGLDAATDATMRVRTRALNADASISSLHHLASGYYEGTEMTAPAAPAADKGRLYFEDNGSGKTRLMCLFATGAAQQIAIQP